MYSNKKSTFYTNNWTGNWTSLALHVSYLFFAFYSSSLSQESINLTREDKKKTLVKWLNDVKQDKTIHARRFMSMQELYELYDHTYKGEYCKLGISSFNRTINYIVRHKTMYENLQRLEKRCSLCRSTTYIIFEDNDLGCDINDIVVYTTRSKKVIYPK